MMRRMRSAPWMMSLASPGFVSGTEWNHLYYTTKYWWGAAFHVDCTMQYPGYNGCLVRVSPYTWSPT